VFLDRSGLYGTVKNDVQNGQVRLNRITAGWADQKVIREIMVFLQSHGVGTARAVRIYAHSGDIRPVIPI
ncbi:MAG TPA: hypothetical protein VKN63_07235, partial [Afifellaceae bacterium]|nr:hypothetical protein [Afifellaceae bacterium]